jgi:hypothetical protein
MLTRLDDELLDHDKIEDAAEALGKRGHILALGLAAFGILYGNRKLTDGFIKAGALAKYGIDEALAAAAVDAGLWDRVEGGYQVHDFLDHNPSAAEVKAKRSKDRERKRKTYGFQGPHTSESLTASTSDSIAESTRNSVKESEDASNGTHPHARTGAPAGAPKGRVGSGQDGKDSRSVDPHRPLIDPLPRNTAWPGRPPVPGFLHRELLQRLGPGETERDLTAFYTRTSNEWTDKAIGDDGLRFWRARFNEWKGTTVKPAAWQEQDRVTRPPDAAATKARIAAMKPEAARG